MARTVTVTLTYQLDDEDKSLGEELRDWVTGDITVLDFIWDEGETTKVSREGAVITITEGE